MSKKQLTLYLFILSSITAGAYGVLHWLKPPSERLFLDYSTRLNRVLSISIEAPNHTPTLPTISWRDGLQVEPELTLSLLDSLALKSCGLDQLVFEKSSSLGKHASADYRLVWHSEFIGGLQTCLNDLQLKPELRLSLAHILKTKLAAIDVYWHNYLLNEQSLRHLWISLQRLSVNPLSAYRALALNLQELSHIHKQLNVSNTIDKEQLLSLSERLQKGASIVALLQELNATSAWLSQVAAALASRQFSCHESEEKYQILQNILSKVYTVKVQDYLAELDQSAGLVLPSLSPLMQQSHPVLLERAHAIHVEFKQANRQHVTQWKLIIESCK
ncbi:DUF3080 family protein [Agarivorans sp. Alg241-V36]|uniref:DUF3080 family protein n=1 Tax=Agarivorans sp. Alg241-V36 TaxID=2305992 RepID=UPI0013D8D994|nr:DUF3080 family protein [Agarivorans sp. Alg241-V36]